MKKHSIVNLLTASAMAVAFMASVPVSASGYAQDQAAMEVLQQEVAAEISENGMNALKIMNKNILLDASLELGSSFRTLQKRVASDEVECGEESLAAEPETLPQEGAAVSQDMRMPGLQSDTLIKIGSVALGVIQ